VNNSRIVNELIEKANEWSYEEYNYKETGYTREQLYSQKLAELIVLECIGCYSPDDSATDWADKMRRMIET
jgi:hypothetical protein